jgi:hypothetical protein
MNKYKELAEIYKEMFENTWSHFIDANELVLDHDYCIDDDVLAEYNEADDVFCTDLKELEKKAKELEKAIAMDEDHEIYKEAKNAVKKDI